MKHWKETSDVLSRAIRMAEDGRKSALATVVGFEGSSYRRPGAKFLVHDDGQTAGSISGGCLEADVREVALEVIRGAPARLLRYDTGGDDRSPFSLGLGCSGSVEIFVRPLAQDDALTTAKAIRELLDGESAFAVVNLLSGPSAGRTLLVRGSEEAESFDDPEDRAVAAIARDLLSRRESRRLTAGPAEVFVEVLVPPPHLALFGAGDDAIPLCAYAADAGFRVTVVDHRENALSAERFPGAHRRLLRRPEEGIGGIPAEPGDLAVVMTHSFAHDREWVRHLLGSDVSLPYVGLLGPRSRSREILAQIGIGAGEIAAARLFAPVGLDLGAEGPEQVALSIVAELLSVHASREPASLRGKTDASAVRAG